MQDMQRIYKLKIDNIFSNSNDIIHAEMDCRFIKQLAYGKKKYEFKKFTSWS